MNISACILILVFLSQLAFGQSQPLKGKGQAQGTYQTIERVQVPNSGVTVTADKAVLMEWDKYNFLANPSFEHQTFGTSWTVNAGTATVDTTNYFDGVKSMSIALSAVNGDILTQCVTPPQQTAALNMMASLRVNSTLTNLQVCSVIGSTEQQCVPTSSSGSWIDVIPTMVGSNGSQYCVKLKSTSSATGTVKVDAGYLGKNLNIGTAAQTKNVVQLNWSGSQTATHDSDVILTLSSVTQTKLENFTLSSGALTALQGGDYRTTFCVRLDYTAASASLMRQQIAKIYKNGGATPVAIGGYVNGLAQNNINSGGEPTNLGTPPPCTTKVITLAIGDVLTFKGYQANGAGTNFNYIAATVDIDYMPLSVDQVLRLNTDPTIGNWEAYTGGCSGSWTSNVTYTCLKRRVGGNLELEIKVTATGVPGPSNTNLNFNLPTGLVIDGTKLANAADGDFQPLGWCAVLDAGVFYYGCVPTWHNSTSISAQVQIASGTYLSQTSSVNSTGGTPIVFGTADQTVIHATVPIVGWSAPTVQMPIVTQSITTTANAAYRQEYAYVLNTGSCAVSSQSSNWITSTTDPGVGQCQLVWAANTWSAAPWCTCTPNAGTGATMCAYLGVLTTTGVNVFTQTAAGGGSSVDSAFYITCTGPK